MCDVPPRNCASEGPPCVDSEVRGVIHLQNYLHMAVTLHDGAMLDTIVVKQGTICSEDSVVDNQPNHSLRTGKVDEGFFLGPATRKMHIAEVYHGCQQEGTQ